MFVSIIPLHIKTNIIYQINKVSQLQSAMITKPYLVWFAIAKHHTTASHLSCMNFFKTIRCTWKFQLHVSSLICRINITFICQGLITLFFLCQQMYTVKFLQESLSLSTLFVQESLNYDVLWHNFNAFINFSKFSWINIISFNVICRSIVIIL